MRGFTKRHEDTLGDNKYVHYLDCDDGFTGIYMCQNIILYTLNKWLLLHAKLYLHKDVLKVWMLHE